MDDPLGVVIGVVGAFVAFALAVELLRKVSAAIRDDQRPREKQGDQQLDLLYVTNETLRTRVEELRAKLTKTRTEYKNRVQNLEREKNEALDKLKETRENLEEQLRKAEENQLEELQMEEAMPVGAKVATDDVSAELEDKMHQHFFKYCCQLPSLHHSLRELVWQRLQETRERREDGVMELKEKLFVLAQLKATARVVFEELAEQDCKKMEVEVVQTMIRRCEMLEEVLALEMFELIGKKKEGLLESADKNEEPVVQKQGEENAQQLDMKEEEALEKENVSVQMRSNATITDEMAKDVRLANLRQQLEETRKDLVAERAHVDVLNRRSAQQNVEMGKKLTELLGRINKSSAEKIDLNLANWELNGRLNLAKEKMEGLNSEVRKLEDELCGTRKNVDRLRMASTKTQAELRMEKEKREKAKEEFEASLDAYKRLAEDKEHQAQALNAKLAVTEGRLADAGKLVYDLQVTNMRIDAQLNIAQTTSVALSTELKTVKEDLGIAQEENQHLRVEKESETGKLRAKVDDMEGQLRGAEAHVRRLKDAYASLDEELDLTREKLISAMDENKRLKEESSEAAGLRLELDGAKAEAEKLLQELNRCRLQGQAYRDYIASLTNDMKKMQVELEEKSERIWDMEEKMSDLRELLDKATTEEPSFTADW